MVNITLTKEQRQEHFRNYRIQAFNAFDKWEKAVLRGREQDDNNVMLWYQEMLGFTDNITETTTWNDYPEIPEIIKYYF